MQTKIATAQTQMKKIKRLRVCAMTGDETVFLHKKKIHPALRSRAAPAAHRTLPERQCRSCMRPENVRATAGLDLKVHDFCQTIAQKMKV